MNKIDRRSFLTGIAGSAVSCAIPEVSDAHNTSEFDKCKNDILYFAEHYIKIPAFDNGDHALYDIQKQYLKNIASNSWFICKKCRQSGITTMNVIYAMWKLLFFENQHIDMVFHKYDQCRQVMRMIMDMNLYDDSFKDMMQSAHCKYTLKNGNVIRFMSYSKFVDSESHYGQNNITILDELAFCDIYGEVPIVVTDRTRMNNTMIAVSTPYMHNDFLLRYIIMLSRIIR